MPRWRFSSFQARSSPIVRFGRRVRKASRKTQAQVSRLAGRLAQSFQGARHVKAYGMEEYEIQRARTEIITVRKLVMQTTRYRAASTAHTGSPGCQRRWWASSFLWRPSRVVAGARTEGELLSFLTALALAYPADKTGSPPGTPGGRRGWLRLSGDSIPRYQAEDRRCTQCKAADTGGRQHRLSNP